VTLRTRDAGGNADLATATLRILPRPSLNVAWVVAAVIGWFGAPWDRGNRAGEDGGLELVRASPVRSHEEGRGAGPVHPRADLRVHRRPSWRLVRRHQEEPPAEQRDPHAPPERAGEGRADPVEERGDPEAILRGRGAGP